MGVFCTKRKKNLELLFIGSCFTGLTQLRSYWAERGSWTKMSCTSLSQTDPPAVKKASCRPTQTHLSHSSTLWTHWTFLLQFICKHRSESVLWKVPKRLWTLLFSCTWPVWLFDPERWTQKCIPEDEHCVRTDRCDEKPGLNHTQVPSHSSSIHNHKRVEK